ncbi:MAG TPA: LysE family translocator [Stellaceae bacterium]|jgi:threonine/homoserine/homoserine lactone efflux protein|nr:LysE family translocator [Stellaceae bacterium]
MTLTSWILFLPACFALNMAFGPNNMLLLTNAAREGVGCAMTAAIGRLLAFAIMIAIAAVGMGAVLMASASIFLALKLAGAAYLVYLGIKTIRKAGSLPPAGVQLRGRTRMELARQEFWVAIGNPKAILIFTAFFPQFLDPQNYWSCFLIMGVTFEVLEIVAMFAYAVLGTRLNIVTRNVRAFGWFNRVSGSMMILFGALLILAKRPAT